MIPKGKIHIKPALRFQKDKIHIKPALRFQKTKFILNQP